jgi:lysozyme
MNINNAGRKLIRTYEGCKLKAYKCSAGKNTIGFGNTFYEDGSAVQMGDVITKDRADALFIIILDGFANNARTFIKQPITDNQFSALVSFAYNAGIGAFKSSTLLRKVNANPNDQAIRLEFMKWDKAGGKVLAGLTRRRSAEADLYFTT